MVITGGTKTLERTDLTWDQGETFFLFSGDTSTFVLTVKRLDRSMERALTEVRQEQCCHTGCSLSMGSEPSLDVWRP